MLDLAAQGHKFNKAQTSAQPNQKTQAMLDLAAQGHKFNKAQTGNGKFRAQTSAQPNQKT